jgi:hypothetical protein
MSILSSTKSGLRNEKLLLTDFNKDSDFMISAYKENMISLPIFYVDSHNDTSCRVVASPMSDKINPEFTFYFRYDSSIFEAVKPNRHPLSDIKTIIINSKYHFNLVKQYVNTPYIEEKKKILLKLQEE